MKVQITSQHFELTEAIKNYTEEKFNKIKNNFEMMSLKVKFIEENGVKVAQADIHVKGNDIHIEEKDENLYAAIDKLTDACHNKLTREKEKKMQKSPKVGRMSMN